jgi:hypothetical protein
MNQRVSVGNGAGASVFNKIPWMFLVIGYLIGAEMVGVTLDGIPGYIFLGVAVFVLFAEFIKSGDINTTVFALDVLWAISGVILATGLMCYLWWQVPDRDPGFFHWFGYVLVVGDAVFSPFNSFRTALRNFAVGS